MQHNKCCYHGSRSFRLCFKVQFSNKWWWLWVERKTILVAKLSTTKINYFSIKQASNEKFLTVRNKNLFGFDWKIVFQWLKNIFRLKFLAKNFSWETVPKFSISARISKTLQVIFHESFDWNKSKTICHFSRWKISMAWMRKSFYLFSPGKKYHKFEAFFKV